MGQAAWHTSPPIYYHTQHMETEVDQEMAGRKLRLLLPNEVPRARHPTMSHWKPAEFLPLIFLHEEMA